MSPGLSVMGSRWKEEEAELGLEAQVGLGMRAGKETLGEGERRGLTSHKCGLPEGQEQVWDHPGSERGEVG